MSGVNHMATLVLAQLWDILDSFARRDVAKAVEVWTRDQDIDKLCTSLSQQLLADIMEKPVSASLGAHLMFCTKNLERMGDHATNVAEAVHYMVKGETLLRERPKADFTSMLTGITTIDCRFIPSYPARATAAAFIFGSSSSEAVCRVR
jgi:phosphate transport system protein